MRPASIKKFEIAYLANLIVGAVGTIFNWDVTLEQFQAGAGAALSPMILIAILVVAYAISLLLWYFVARRASNIAKWIVVVFTLFGLIGLPAFFVGAFSLVKGIGLLSLLLSVTAVIFLFMPDARLWFAGYGNDDPETLNETFE
ncbi:hypothetical protein [Novosphingopyxis sp.]|uniref:hypothetical protein n=1 Tax=Novosphingopyxis sp. TaxID=2709690 RepID=UPI003B5B3AA7